MGPYLIHWLAATIAVMITAYVVPGFHVNSVFSAIIAAVVIGFVNIVIWPVLVVLTLPLTVLTFGLFLLVVNGVSLKIAAGLTPGFSIDGFLPAAIGSIVLAAVGWLIRFLMFSGPSAI
ncbi:MAG: phage holin family protein [Proteobacteria bacterium]|nr:phage holin family protein [Pseudomonadota bacterium]